MEAVPEFEHDASGLFGPVRARKSSDARERVVGPSFEWAGQESNGSRDSGATAPTHVEERIGAAVSKVMPMT